MFAAQTPSRPARFSGHETFACRHAWLPKAYRGLVVNPNLFTDETSAMVELGLGRNMVRSLRFWVEAMGLASVGPQFALIPTDFGHQIFADGGHDPYLEDVRTLWLLHWKLSSRHEGPLFAWQYLLGLWPYPEFTRSEALTAFVAESARRGHTHSEVTLAQHLDVFLRTYCPPKGKGIQIEDALDGPLTSLMLLESVGQRRNAKGRWEETFAFRRGPKPEIGPTLFAHCIQDYWNRFRPLDDSLTLREIALWEASPGRVLQLPEADVRSRLDAYADAVDAPFRYQPSAIQGILSRKAGGGQVTLAEVYGADPVNE